MTGTIIKRVRHACVNGQQRWVQLPKTTKATPCAHCGADITKGPLRYDCVYRAGGKQRWKTFKTSHDAARFLTNTVKTVQDGNYTHVKPMLMGDLFDRWLSHSLEVRAKQGLLKPSTVKSYRSMLKTHLRPAFKDYRSDQLTAEAVSDWERARADDLVAKKMTAKSYNHLVALLHVILAWARARGQRYLAHDPLADVRRLPGSKVEPRFLQPDEIMTLLDAAETPDDTILYLAVYSGLRRGELFSVQWGDLDEDAAQLRVRRSIYQGDITRPKTKHSERTVDLPARIVTLLQDYRKTYPPLDGDFVFRTDTGTPLDPDNWFKRSFVPTAVKAKLRPAEAPAADDDEQRIGLHTLRHTYASLLINQGESIKYVSKQLGHASIQITADLYGHLFKETSVSAMNRLSMRIPLTDKVKREDEAVA